MVAAVRGLALLLHCTGPGGINALDKDGLSALHRLASTGEWSALQLCLCAQVCVEAMCHMATPQM